MASSGVQMAVGGFSTGLTALVGGGVPTLAANTLSSGVNVVATVATAGDSMILPAGIPQGGKVLVVNTAAAVVDISVNTGATQNGVTTQRGIAALAMATYVQVGTDGLTWVCGGTQAPTA